ncbi:MAG: hypothetical protein ACRC5T_01955 [Cetobacterium sp.]
MKTYLVRLEETGEYVSSWSVDYECLMVRVATTRDANYSALFNAESLKLFKNYLIEYDQETGYDFIEVVRVTHLKGADANV